MYFYQKAVPVSTHLRPNLIQTYFMLSLVSDFNSVYQALVGRR